MALRFMDGFDHWGTGSSVTTVGKWSAGNATPSAAVARTGPYSFRLTQTGTADTKPYVTSGGAIVGVAVRTDGGVLGSGGGEEVIMIREGTTTTHLALAIVAGVLQIRRGTTVIATGTSVLAANSWYYLELLAVIHDTTGSYEVRVDGVPEPGLSGPSATNVDTRNGGTGVWDRVRLVGFCAGASAYYDDFYLCDQGGAAPHNTFLGVCKVETLFPQTGNGSNVGLTPSTGTDHGALVDEPIPNTTDYNGSTTVGAKDTYHYPSLTLPGSVLGIQTNLYVNKSDTAPRQVCAVVRTGGVDYDGASVVTGTTFVYESEVRALNPGTGLAWTTAEIDAIEAGMKVTA